MSDGIHVGFKASAAATVKMVTIWIRVVWKISADSLEGSAALFFTLEMEIALFYETLIPTYKITQRQVPEH